MTQPEIMREWWRGATIYQIYPRSFQDSTNNGIGDLPGITRRLSYVRDLGVDAIWLSPFFKSPMKDFGYDVSDFCDVDPMFGTLHDFDRLIAEAHRLDLKVIIDQVYSHSSNEHPWFEESASSRDNEKADWYVWSDPGPAGEEPNNWQSIFGGRSWTWSPIRQQYYLHNFLIEQPDLNLHSEAVQSAILDVARFWLERGVSGFRLDALQCLIHDTNLEDNPPRIDPPPSATRPFALQEHCNDHRHPAVGDFLARVRQVTDEYDAVFTVAEVGGWDPLPLMKDYAGAGRLSSAYSFDFLSANSLDAEHIRKTVSEWSNDPGDAWPSWAFSNHDAPRVASRWGDVKPLEADIRLFALLQFSLRGNVFLYQGEELGLEQADVPFEKMVDPEGLANWPLTMGRDGARTPMPWEQDAPNAGFSDAKTWLPIDPRHPLRAVDQQVGSADSTLSFFKALLAIRQKSSALRSGDLDWLESPDGTLAFMRRSGDSKVACLFNLTHREATIPISEIGSGAHLLISNSGVELNLDSTTATLPARSGVFLRVD